MEFLPDYFQGIQLEPGWVNAAAAFTVTFLALWILKSVVIRRIKHISKKTANEFDDFIVESVEKIPSSLMLLAALFVAQNFLEPPEIVGNIIWYGFLVVGVFFVLKISNNFVDYGKRVVIERRRQANPNEDVSIINLMARLVKYLLILLAVLVFLSNAGVEITSLIAGLGVGGLAIALALQNILEDLFSSFSIYFDKPYQVGDFLIIGDDLGVVEKIGIKSTRINTLRGEELVVSNREMTQTRVHNFGRMPHRRITFSFGLTYDTPVEVLRRVPAAVREIIEGQENTRFDRAHFKEYGDSSLNFEVVYYVETADYNVYMDIQQEVNLQLKERIEGLGSDFAFPTRTLYLNKE